MFTFEKEFNGSFPSLGILVEKSETEIIISVYRKQTFTGQYLRRNSFSIQEEN